MARRLMHPRMGTDANTVAANTATENTDTENTAANTATRIESMETWTEEISVTLG